MRKLSVGGIGLALLLVGSIGIGLTQISEGQESLTYTKSSSQEGFFRPHLPVGEYACRIFTNYSGGESLPQGYLEATAFILDEGEDTYETMSTNGDQNVKFVSVIERPGSSADQDELWEFQRALANFWTSDTIRISDTTPRVEISLSRAFRQRDLRWTFQCVEFGWPE